MSLFTTALLLTVIVLIRAAIYAVSAAQNLPDSAIDFWVFCSQIAAVSCFAQAWLGKHSKWVWVAFGAAWLVFACARLYGSARATSLSTVASVELAETLVLLVAPAPIIALIGRAIAPKGLKASQPASD